jgi:Condensation domain
VRFFVLRFGERHHWLVMKLHHIVYDIWSLPIFYRELDALYRAFAFGRNSPLPERHVQLADFAVWQRRYLHPGSTALRAQVAYWKDQLSGELPTLRLPCERPDALQAASIADVLAPFEMSEELSAKVRAITRAQGTTLFITFLAGLKALINLTTGQNDIMLGVYFAKRTVPGSEEMMGYFCDLVFLRTRVSSHLSFLELLRLVRETVLNAHVHEDLPFDVLREEIEKAGQIPPALRAIFMFETVSDLPFRLGDLQVNGVPLAARTTMPWRFQMRVRDGGAAFSGRAKFDACLHDPPLVRRMMRNYVRLLEAVVARPAMRLCEVEEELGSW